MFGYRNSVYGVVPVRGCCDGALQTAFFILKIQVNGSVIHAFTITKVK